MPDGLYEHDVLAWSQQQADLLRRLAQGERVNDVDWANVAEEIEDVGLSELHAVESHLNLMIVHLLKIQAWPDSTALDHWRTEIAVFQRNARRRFTPSMRQRLNLAALYTDALDALRIGDRRNNILRPWPDCNPFTVDQLLNDDPDDLVGHLVAADPPSGAGHPSAPPGSGPLT